MNTRITKKWLSLLLCLALLVCCLTGVGITANAADAPFQIHFIDVGQADAMLVICDEETMLVDGGNVADSQIMYTYLQKLNITHLDYVIGTHAHEDHIGGIPGALQYVSSIGTVYCPVTSYSTSAFSNFVAAVQNHGKSIQVPTIGTTFTLGDAVCKIIAVNTPSDDVNDSSIVMRITYGDNSFMLTGDAELPVETLLLEGNEILKSDVLKVGHHGSSSSTSYLWLRTVDPDYAVICVGADNTYGHPTDAVLSRLRDAEVTTYRTDLHGDILCTSDGKNITFTTASGESSGGTGDTEDITGTSDPQITYPAETISNTAATSVSTGNAYKLVLDRNGTKYYFTGKTDSASYYLASSTDPDTAVTVYLEGTQDNYQMYFMNNGVKTYIRLYERSSGKANLQLTTSAPTECYKFDTTLKTLVYTKSSSNSYYMGTYSSYTNFRASNLSYISGSNASKVDVSQFPARLYAVDTNENAVSQWGVTLKENIGLTFRMNFTSAILADEDAYVSVLFSGEEWKIPVSEAANGISLDIAAAQMTEEITLCTVAGNGTRYKTGTYSIRKYADYVLAGSYGDNVKNLVKEMLNYGAMAQICFEYNLQELANAGITGTAAAIIPEATEEPTVNDTISTLDFYGASFLYQDKIGVRYYFTGNVSGCTFAVNDIVCTPVSKDGMHYIEFADIMPQNLMQGVTLIATDEAGNTLCVTYSPIDYIVRMHQKGGNDLQNLLQALYNYHLAAKAYAL